MSCRGSTVMFVPRNRGEPDRPKSAHPAWVYGTSPRSRPARYASYPPLAPGEVAYLPVWSPEGRGQERQESVVLQDVAGGEASATATARGPPRTQPTSLDVESRAMGVIKNLPSRCRDVEVLDVISKLGFGSDVTAFSMPTRVQKDKRMLNKGFAFVYFSDERVCRQFVQAAAGHHN